MRSPICWGLRSPAWCWFGGVGRWRSWSHRRRPAPVPGPGPPGTTAPGARRHRAGHGAAGRVLILGEAIRNRRELDLEREKSERLLLNVLPDSIAARLKQTEGVIADDFPEVTVLFADIVDFTGRSERITPEQVVEVLNDLFSAFDRLTRQRGLEKIKTIGDAYMVGGLPEPRSDHAEAVAEMALAILGEVAGRSDPGGQPLQVRIGIDTGPVVAGVIGQAGSVTTCRATP
jgi:class 3 adenylate cyclase